MNITQQEEIKSLITFIVTLRVLRKHTICKTMTQIIDVFLKTEILNGNLIGEYSSKRLR